jgi:hypothetical protein
VVAAAIGDTWAYYIVGSVVEVLLLLSIAAVAWFWPTPASRGAEQVPKSTDVLAARPKSRHPSHR